MDISILIPCYNEVDNVDKLQNDFFPVALGLADSCSVEVIFVDDGSTDGTEAALKNTFGQKDDGRVSIRFEKHETNRGLGAALRTGFAAASGTVIVTTDSDGTYHFSEISNLLAYLKPDVGMVIASPYHPQGAVMGVPGYRLLLSRGSSAIYRILVSRKVWTYTSLFRAYRRELVERVSFKSDGFLAGTELLVKAVLMGYRVQEYPATLHSRALGVSKARLVRTTRAHLGFQMKVLLHRAGVLHLAQS